MRNIAVVALGMVLAGCGMNKTPKFDNLRLPDARYMVAPQKLPRTPRATGWNRRTVRHVAELRGVCVANASNQSALQLWVKNLVTEPKEG